MVSNANETQCENKYTICILTTVAKDINFASRHGPRAQFRSSWPVVWNDLPSKLKDNNAKNS